jgi:hypothetical protein
MFYFSVSQVPLGHFYSKLIENFAFKGPFFAGHLRFLYVTDEVIFRKFQVPM